MTDSSVQQKQILKSTSLVGGSQVIIILVGIIRTKVLAVLLGPMGVGLIGLFQSVIDLIRGFTGLGISFSSVKDIAQANESGETQQIARKQLALKRWIIVTGSLGALSAILFSRQISIYIFGTDENAFSITLLSIAILMTTISAGQIALLQGLRMISKMAKANVLASVVGLAVVIPVFYFYGVASIAPALILISLSSLVVSWWYVARLKFPKIRMSAGETFREGISMVRLGLYTVASGFVMTGVFFLLRAFISRTMDVEAVGLFQAAYSISAVYLGTVLTSMGADYFPRLCGASSDNQKVNSLVNIQTSQALIIGSPLVIAMILFAPLIIRLFYSTQFFDAVIVLQWMMLGSFMRFVTWPLAYFLLAKNRGLFYLVSESTMMVIYFVLIWLGLEEFGLKITGIALLGQYIYYILFLYFFGKGFINLRFNRDLIRLFLVYSILVTATFLFAILFKSWLVYSGIAFLFASVYISYKKLNEIVDLRLTLKKIFTRSQG